MIQNVAVELDKSPLPPGTRRHIPALDGLRGFAALIVVIYHAVLYSGLSAWAMMDSPETGMIAVSARFAIRYFLFYGYSGVELFFLISGFCLLYPHFCAAAQRFDLRKYSLRRAMRIYPPYLAALALSITVIVLGAPLIRLAAPQALDPIRASSIVESLLLLNSHYNQVFWTLVIEAKWYLVVPILIVLWKRSSFLMHAFIPLLIVVLWLTREIVPGLQLGTFAHYLPLFWMGICLAEFAAGHAERWTRRTVNIAASMVSFVGFFAVVFVTPGTPSWSHSLRQSFPFGIFYLGLFALALFSTGVARFFEWRVLVRLGEFSYSLYLVHALVLYLAAGVFSAMSLSGAALLAAELVIAVPACVLAGYLFFLAAEKPTMRPAGA
jgi:peptidoglycan/LPS O-acetylase OafA/YrhL